jgi:hypothetical protein
VTVCRKENYHTDMRVLAAMLILVLGSAVEAGQSRRTPPPAPAPRQAPAPTPRQTPAPRREATVPFTPGESLTFDVSWSQLVTAGTAAIRVVEKKTAYNSTVYSIVADGSPVPLLARLYPLYYKMETLLDSFTLLSHWTSTRKEENSTTRQTSMRFDRAAGRVHFESPSENPSSADLPVASNTQDGLATLFALRARSFRAGERITMPVADEGALYTLGVDVAGPEPVSVPSGRFDAWNLRLTIVNASGEQVGKNIAIWISNDARRLPVKIQAELPVGSFVLGLRNATR